MRQTTTEKTTHPALIFWIVAGWVGFVLLPWYGVEDFWFMEWLTDGWPLDTDYAPALFLLLQGEKPWLWPVLPALAAPLLVMRRPKTDP
ncbi:MAG: iron ABC transporter permease, partial [Rhodobacteraceae bacterium]|nr:iron ABC transporter permease [Paracoccaceae bacterium]